LTGKYIKGGVMQKKLSLPLALLLLLLFIVHAGAFTKNELMENAQITFLAINEIKKQTAVLEKYSPREGEKFADTADKNLTALIQKAADSSSGDLAAFLSDLAKETSPAKINEACLARYKKNQETLRLAMETLEKWTKEDSSVSKNEYKDLKNSIYKCLAENKVLINVIREVGDYSLPRLAGLRMLCDAIKEGDWAKFERAFKDGADVRQRDIGGTHALHLAVSKGNKQMVEKILSQGADVNALNNSAMMNHELFNLVFVKDGMKAVSVRLMTTMMKRQKEVQSDIRTGKIDIANGYGYTPLQIAAHKGFAEIAAMLMDKGSDMEAQETLSGFTALQLAALNGQKETALLLLKKGAKINAASPRSLGVNSLMLALAKGKNDVALLLLESGADVKTTMELGLTPIHYAAAKKAKTLAEMMIAQGADINARDNFGNTPLKLARIEKDAEMEELLKSKGAQ